MSDTLNFLHISMGRQKNTTLLNAIRKNNLSTWPFFTDNSIAKFLPESMSTALGHQDRTQKNSQSTQQPTFETTENMYINIYTPINKPEMPTGKIHSDQTRQFPIQSSSGKIYIMAIYAYDPNYILVKPLPDISNESIVQSYQKNHPTTHKETFQAKALKTRHCGIQTPPRLYGQKSNTMATSDTRKSQEKYSGATHPHLQKSFYLHPGRY